MGTLVVTGSGENLEAVGPGAGEAVGFPASEWPPFWPWNRLPVSCPPVAASGAGGEGDHGLQWVVAAAEVAASGAGDGDPGLQWVVVAALAASGCGEIAGGGGGLLARQRPGWPPWAGGRWPWPSLQLAPLLKLAQALPMVGPAALEPPGWMSRSLSR